MFLIFAGLVDWCVCEGPKALLFPGMREENKEHVMCMVTEIAALGDLGKEIDKAKANGTPLAEERIWKWVMQTTAALGELHKHFVIHRDIKPANIFLDSDDNVKLGDLGIAKELEDESKNAETFLGSPLYIAPEVLEGQYGRKCDIWSLGVALHQLMALQPPFMGNNQPHLFRNIGRFAPAKIEPELGYSNRLILLTQWMMQKDPQHRPRAIDIYAHLTNSWPKCVQNENKQLYVDAQLAAKTFGQADLDNEEARMILDISRSLGAPPTSTEPLRRSMPDALTGISEISLESSTMESTMATLEPKTLDIIKKTLSKGISGISESAEEFWAKTEGGEPELQFKMQDGRVVSWDDMLAMRDLSETEIESLKTAREAEASNGQVDLDWVFATTFFGCVQETETAMDMDLVRKVGNEIKAGEIKTLDEIETFFLASKQSFPGPKAWAWVPKNRFEERELLEFANEVEDRTAGSENWLLLQYRQELFQWNRTVLQRFFGKIGKIVDGKLSSVVGTDLAADVNRQLANPKRITSVPELERYLKSITANYREAFAWTPKYEEQAALMKFDPEFCLMDMTENSGCWLNLKIRQELCAFDPSI